MISDVPGYTWGLVPVLAQSGIKYFSWGPNPNDHLGYARGLRQSGVLLAVAVRQEQSPGLADARTATSRSSTTTTTRWSAS